MGGGGGGGWDNRDGKYCMTIEEKITSPIHHITESIIAFNLRLNTFAAYIFEYQINGRGSKKAGSITISRNQ